MDLTLTNLTNMILAVGALGTAAYGLVDATKAAWGGVSNAGFVYIRRVIEQLVPRDSAKTEPLLLGSDALLTQLKASWVNGVPLADQRTIAKTLIKLRLNPDNAKAFAEKLGVDGNVLTTVATKMSTGKALESTEPDVFGRFDLILTTALDQAYQRADQRYRNWCKLVAIPIALLLAIVGGWTLQPAGHFCMAILVKSVIAGLLATPLAPVAKDLASAVQAGAKAVQAIKK
jgi:hypothetical protein